MVPKIIHYCWLGNNEKSLFIKECIKSWEKLGYEIKEWNEKNYDVNQHQFVKKNYEQKKWAFVSDYIRLDVLYKYGGIYLDTDVKIFKKFSEEFFKTDLIIPFQFNCLLGTHFIGAKKESLIIKELLELYNGKINNDVPNNDVFNNYFLNLKDFKLNGKTQSFSTLGEKIIIYSKDKLSCPNLLKGSYAIHYLDNSWREKSLLKKKIQYFLKKILGDRIYYNLLCYKALKISPYYKIYLKNKHELF